MRIHLLLSGLFALAGSLASADEFRVLPYVQNPATDAITVRWLTSSNTPGTVTVETPQGARVFESQPVEATALSYSRFAEEPGGPHPAVPFLHSIRITELTAGTPYQYMVTQGAETHSSTFSTAPNSDQPIRFLVYSDPETEPESSTSPPVDWPVGPGSNRPDGITKYLVDQTIGYRENLKVMQSRAPNFISLVGDLVETGGEQRDWDELWKHNAGDYGWITGSVPILPAIGNHENYAGPGGGYTVEGALYSTAKYLTYFDVPDNGASDPRVHGRYYRIDYGPITLIALDSSDGLPHKSEHDTNHNLEPGAAPDFNPGSEQYAWLEKQLAEAQQRSRFTFVQYHHTAYGSGPHSVPFGNPSFSGQFGIPMRVLQPLFMQYGVDIVFSGHDELMERSLVTGVEMRTDGAECEHQIQYYDSGVGGDGLRGSSANFDNPARQFLVHDDAPEVWEAGRLVSGGKHYGHLEVNVRPDESGKWSVTIEPVHVFPVTDASGAITGWERRIYNDVVTITE
ncbi:MAG: metallophosphoesterase family protein [Planctomycetaceae bacterium]|nr:metallophosphoesterase family protein [Planctomycetaceae bacterium]